MQLVRPPTQLRGMLFKPKRLQVFPLVLETGADVNPCGSLSSLYIPHLVWFLGLKEQDSPAFTAAWLEP